MKKNLLALTLILLISAPSFAVLSTDEGVSAKYIKQHGYSDEMVRLMDLQHSQIMGAPVTYERKEPKMYSDKRVKLVRRLFMYLDPGLDDHYFMQNDIQFTNRYDDL